MGRKGVGNPWARQITRDAGQTEPSCRWWPQVFNLLDSPLGTAHAPSPDVRCAHPGLHSLDAALASPGTDPPQADWSWLRSASNACSRARAAPRSPTLYSTATRCRRWEKAAAGRMPPLTLGSTATRCRR